jgi:hypothetical protein
MLAINPTTPSLSLCLGCAIFLILVAFLSLREPKKKKKAETVTLKNCTQSYIAILQKISECGTPAELSRIYDLADDFRSRFTGTTNPQDLNDFYENVLKEIAQRRQQLMLSRQFSKVS